MSEAEAQVGAGAIDSAIRTFDLAAQADPTQKDPWVRSAQLQFDAGSYGRAIVAAQEALQRDPGDLVADSVLTLGGFRVAGESLKRLQAGGALSSESARSEAKQLAESMRSIMGDEIVDIAKPTPAPRSTRRSSRRSATPAPKPAPAPAPKPASGDPFNKLGGN
ncbi:hypothetical protein CSC70_00235 [Pseudoxanthomonas kalamensis DSM 18571]|nr:hypothetical protein CSC70_00235 [Pseudoxanthomonas kalamensis DSM 18571]